MLPEPLGGALGVSSEMCILKGCRQADRVATRPPSPCADCGYFNEALLTGNLWALLELFVKEV